MKATGTLPTLIYEDEHILVINKPAQYHSVNKKLTDHSSIEDWLQGVVPGLAELGLPDGGLVNRLDFETSGILLAAKSREAREKLVVAINEKPVVKTYYAILEGCFPEKRFVSNYIGNRYRHSRKVNVFEQPNDRSLLAESSFEPCLKLIGQDISLVTAQITRGRRHQIRAHAAWLGYPLLGDSLYGAERTSHQLLKQPDIPGFFLHSHFAGFTHPFTGLNISFSAPVPSYFLEVFPELAACY